MSARPLEIFRAGAHTDMSGRTIRFTTSDLTRTAHAYDPAKHEAPLVVGHPQTDDPAYGLVAELQITGDALEAIPHQIDPAFATLVNAGRFSKISASFFMPDAPGNPVPGVYYLRHIGFLGAAAPAVKGLRKPQFSESGIGIVSFIEDRHMTYSTHQNSSPDDALIERFALDLQATHQSMGQSISFTEALNESRARFAEATQAKPKAEPETNDVLTRLAKTLQDISRRNGKELSWDEALTAAREKLGNRIRGKTYA